MPCDVCDTEKALTYTCPECGEGERDLCRICVKQAQCSECDATPKKWVLKVDIEKEEESSKKSRKRVLNLEKCEEKAKEPRKVSPIPEKVLDRLKKEPQKYADERAKELDDSDDLTGQETLCITVLKKGEEYKVLITYSFGEYGYDGYASSAKDYEEFQDPPDPIRHDVRGVDKPNSFYLYEIPPEDAKDVKMEDGKVPNARTKAEKRWNKAVDHAIFVGAKNGKKYHVDGPAQAYVANKTPGGRNDNHAEMRALRYAKKNGYEVVAMAPTHPCCPHCYNKMCTTRDGKTVDDKGPRDIDRVPQDRRVKGEGMPYEAKKLYKMRDQDNPKGDKSEVEEKGDKTEMEEENN